MVSRRPYNPTVTRDSYISWLSTSPEAWETTWLLSVLTCLTIRHQRVTLRRYPALKDALLQVLDLITSSTSRLRLSCLRYVYFLYPNLHMEKQWQHLFKRSRIHSFGLIGMASFSREPLSRQCLHCRRQKLVLKAAILRIPSICQESRWNTFVPSCVFYIHCAFDDTRSWVFAYLWNDSA